MRSTAACIARVAARGKLSDNDAEQIILGLSDRADALRAGGAADPLAQAAREAIAGVTEKARGDRLDALNNAVKRSQMFDRATAISAGGSTGLAPENSRLRRLTPGMKRLGAADGIRALMHFVPGSPAKDNAEGLWQTLARSLIAAADNRLRRAELDRAALAMKGSPLEGEVAEAMWRNHGGAPDASVAVSANAQRIADALSPPLDLVKRRQNAEGARIGTAINYVTHTNWDPRQLRHAAGAGAPLDDAFRAWLAKDRPRMAEKSFDGIEPREGETAEAAKLRFLRSFYDASSSGVHLRGPGMAGMAGDDGGYIPPAFEGTRNIARSVSQPRIITWKTAADWLGHMRDFGGGDGLYAQVARTLDTGARRTALMQYFGTNPMGNLNLVIDRIVREFRARGDLDGLARFQKEVPNLKNTMGRLDGSLNMPANADREEAFETLMTLEATAHLGGVSLTHLSAAPATFSSELAHHGVNRFDSIAGVVKAIAAGRNGADADALADSGAYAHSFANAVARATGAGDQSLRGQVLGRGDRGIPGWLSWRAAQFMRLTGLPRVLDNIQAKAVKGVLMDRLGRQAGAALSELEPHQQTLLRAYGIGDGEWDLIRGAGDPATVGGRRWITPSDGINSDAGAAEALLRARGALADDAAPDAVSRAVQQFQWGLADKLGMYLNDAADRGAVRPGVRERAMVLGDLRPGDKSYMLWRALAQFKMWPLAAANQILGRDIAMSLSGKEMATNIGALIALATAGGAIRMAVNDAAIGNSQRDWSNPVTLLAALAQGGGLGIYGDFLFGETSRLGANGLATAIGPIGSDIDRLYTMYNDFRAELRDRPDHALAHLWPDLARFAIGHVPFANLVYLKGALDYLLWYHVYEAASPGWWERSNRRMAAQQGRVMAGYVPGQKIPWTPWTPLTGRLAPGYQPPPVLPPRERPRPPSAN